VQEKVVDGTEREERGREKERALEGEWRQGERERAREGEWDVHVYYWSGDPLSL
jgi:hypothetical protein